MKMSHLEKVNLSCHREVSRVILMCYLLGYFSSNGSKEIILKETLYCSHLLLIEVNFWPKES